MKDFLGKEIEIGNHVVYIDPHYNSGADYDVGRVTGFTAKFVVMAVESWNGREVKAKKSPKKLIILNESDTLRYQLGQRPEDGEWIDK